MVKSRKRTPYRAKAPGGRLLGYFDSPVDAALCYARHLPERSNNAPLALTAVSPVTGAVLELRLSPRSPTGYWGVRLVASGHPTRPFLARLGPSAADFIGYFATAREAATAVAEAVISRDGLLADLIGDEPALLDPPAEPSADASVDELMANEPALLDLQSVGPPDGLVDYRVASPSAFDDVASALAAHVAGACAWEDSVLAGPMI